MKTIIDAHIFLCEEIKSGLNCENVCFHSIQELFLYLLSKKIKIKVYKTKFCCCLMWVGNIVPHIRG